MIVLKPSEVARLEKAKYVKREGSPGHYKYTYKVGSEKRIGVGSLLEKLQATSTRKIKPEAEQRFLEVLKEEQKDGLSGRHLDNMVSNRCQNLSNVQLSILYLKHKVPGMENTISMKRAVRWLGAKDKSTSSGTTMMSEGELTAQHMRAQRQGE